LKNKEARVGARNYTASCREVVEQGSEGGGEGSEIRLLVFTNKCESFLIRLSGCVWSGGWCVCSREGVSAAVPKNKRKC
jgi:hypothetical protein